MSPSLRSLQSARNHLFKGQIGGGPRAHCSWDMFQEDKMLSQRHGTEGLKKENGEAAGELGAWCVRGLVEDQGRLQNWLEISRKRNP